MGVPSYKTTEKVEVNELIEKAVDGGAVFHSTAIEHYSLSELEELAKQAKDKGLIVTIKAEYSNFYQGVLVSVSKKEDAKKYL